MSMGLCFVFCSNNNNHNNKKKTIYKLIRKHGVEREKNFKKGKKEQCKRDYETNRTKEMRSDREGK